MIDISKLYKGFTGRLVTVTVVLLLTQGMLLSRLWYEQVGRGEEHRKTVSRQSIRRIRLAPIRGRIISRDGVFLADNLPSHDVCLHIHEMRQPGKWQATLDYVYEQIDYLASVTGHEPEEGLLPENRNYRKFECLKCKYVYQLRPVEEPLLRCPKCRGEMKRETDALQRHIMRYPALPIKAFTDLDNEQLARVFGLPSGQIPGLEVTTSAKRVCPLGDVGAHLIGFVGRQDPEQEPDREDYSYFAPELTGSSGLEKVCNEHLKGEGGLKMVRVDSMGYYHDTLTAAIQPHAGDECVLTIDSRAQQIAQKLLTGKRGAMVVLDCTSGAVRAIVSSPSYELNQMSGTRYGALAADKENRPLRNRAIAGDNAPGSIVKPLVALALLESGKADTSHTFRCDGGTWVGRQRIGCTGFHEDVAVTRAIETSCNAFFVQAGLLLGIKDLNVMYTNAGIGQPTGFDLDLSWHRTEGRVPDRDAKYRVTGVAWNAYDTALISMGQGFIEASPLQAAVFAAAIANGGTLYRPYVIESIVGADGKALDVTKSAIRSQLMVSQENLNIIKDAMWRVIHGQEGSAKLGRSAVIELAGKTGTAQVGSGVNRRENTWFICFGPYRNPKYSVAVFVEDGVSGGKTCAPMARRFFEEYLPLLKSSDN